MLVGWNLSKLQTETHGQTDTQTIQLLDASEDLSGQVH